MNIAISGANGFIGKNLTLALKKIQNVNLYYINRFHLKDSLANKNDYSFEDFFKGRINAEFDFFIHLASPNYDYCNDGSLNEGIIELTRKVLNSLSKYNCKNLIFFSTCKVYGESTLSKEIYNEMSTLRPVSDYANAKVEAENLIKEVSKKDNINYLIYRMPFVYGPGMKSNISKLLSLIDKSIPVPTFGHHNGLKKSFLSTENIIKAVSYNLKNPDSVDNGTYNLSDTESVSLDFFLKEYKRVSGAKTIIISFSKSISNIFFQIPIINKIIIKIFGNFQIDNTKILKKIDNIFISTSEGISMLIIGKIDKYE